MRIQLRLVIAVLLLTTALWATPAADASHSWGNYHWARTANPFTLRVVDSMTSTWDSHLNTALSDWSASSVLDLVREEGATDNSTRKRCPAPTGKIRACNANYGYNGWLGLAQIWVSGDHIVKAVAKMNDSYFNTSTYNTPAWRQLVVCQEIAHGFGLGHQDENFNNPNLGSCMDYTNDPDGGPGGASDTDPSNEHPNQHDFDQLVTIYGSHTDSTTTIASGAGSSGPGRGNGGNGASADDDEEHFLPPWAGPAHGNVYETDLGNGVRVITHVIWVHPGLPGARP